MKLYYVPRTRAGRVRWMLEELAVPYEISRLDPALRQQKDPAYLALNPNGTVPTLTDGDVTMYESAAICMYLADKFPDAGLAPPLGSRDRALYYQWIVYAMVTVEPRIINA